MIPLLTPCNVTLFEGANKVIKMTESLYHNNNKAMFNSKETSTWSESHVTAHDVTMVVRVKCESEWNSIVILLLRRL